jgi:hypothetical protein
MKQEDKVENFDFGFSFVDEEYDEIKETSYKLQQDNQDTLEEVKDLQKRLNMLHAAIVPFLDNLCKNPEKSTILWPNRVEKIQMYKNKLRNIVEGNI